MLSQKIKNSPAKQNISPQRLCQSPQKPINTIDHLFRFLKQHNIPISAHLSQTFKDKKSECQFNLKQIKSDQSAQIKSLRIKLNDTLFQLKKTDQDFAQYKVLSKLQKQKTVKKLNSQIETLKKKVEEDNTNWQKRVNQMSKNYKQQKQAFQQIRKNQTKRQIQQTKKQLKNAYQYKLNYLQSQIQLLNSKLKEKQNQLQIQKQKISKQLQQKTKIQISEIKTINIEKQKEITKKLEAKIENIQKQKKNQIQKQDQTINKHLKEQEKLNNQIYYLKKNVQQLNNELKSKERIIMRLELVVRTKQQVYTDIRQDFQKQKVQIEKKNSQNIQTIKQQHSKQIKDILNRHLNQLDSYYQRINNLEQRKISIQDQYKDEFIILQEKFGKRLSKTQDLDQIKRLRNIIAIKDRQIARYQDQLKSSQLQRQNNQKNYTRIFSAHTSRRKSAVSHRDRQAFFKQSNTTDLKLLLKICNKDF